MRVLISSYFFLPSIGGVERGTWLLARGLVQRGHSVQVIAARLGGAPAREQMEGFEVVRVPAGGGSRWTRMATYLAGMAAAVVRARPGAQVLQVQQALYPAAAAALLTLPLRLPLVVGNQGSGPEGAVQVMRPLPLGRASLRLIGRRATCIAVNDEMVEEMRAEGFRRLVRIPNGVVLPSLDEAGRLEARRALGLEGQVVLFLGRLEPVKGLGPLLRAWAQAPRPGATLLVVGDGAERGLVERAAAESAPDRRVRYDGPTTAPARYQRAADLFVLPSFTEGLSNALLEALAHGLPVLASDIGGNREPLAQGGGGLLVPPGDEGALSAALSRLLADPASLARMGAAARATAERTYSVEAMVLAHERLYEQVIAEG